MAKGNLHNTKVKRGRFIVFEGIDGAGSTTQVNLLLQNLKSKNTLVVAAANPTDRSRFHRRGRCIPGSGGSLRRWPCCIGPYARAFSSLTFRHSGAARASTKIIVQRWWMVVRSIPDLANGRAVGFLLIRNRRI